MGAIISQIKQYKRDTILAPVFAALEVCMEVMIPFITSMIIDRGLQAGNIRNVYVYGLVLLVIAAFSLVFGALAGNFAASASAGVAGNMRNSIYRHIQEFSFSNIDKFGTPGLVTRLTTDVTNLQNAFQMVIRIAVRAPMTFILCMIMASIINAELSMIFLIPVAFLAVVLVIILTITTKIFNKVFDEYDDLNTSVQENISAIRVVKAYVHEKFEGKKFQKAAEKLCQLFTKAEGILTLNHPSMMLVVYGCIIAISWFGAHFIVAGNMTTGQLTSMISYVLSIMMSLMMLSNVFVMIAMSSASIRRIKEVLDEQSELHDPAHPLTKLADGSIDFDHVSFSYKQGSGKDVLHDIDLHIRSGETIGIIGSTGCGKSSLVNLICRLYDVKSGQVKVGGHDVKEYSLETLREQVAVVLQKNVLFSGTILENLRWGKPDATEQECIAACKIACADEFIEQFPDQYNTFIDRGGTNVSGGQKQRLCIARALLKKAKILILDDSTSAVDTATDAKIRHALSTKIPDTTKIIIAQRISSVETADRIIVLEGGRINGIGSHEELLKTNDIYRSIYESQTQGGGDFDQAN